MRSIGITIACSALLVVTLGLKAAAPRRDGGELNRRLTGFLAEAGFTVADTEFWTGGIPIIRGRRGDCQVFLMSASSPGWSNDLIQLLAQGDDQVFSVLDGHVHAGQPGWWTAIVYRWANLVRDVSLSPQTAMVLAVVAQPSCDAGSWNWLELASPPARRGPGAGS